MSRTQNVTGNSSWSDPNTSVLHASLPCVCRASRLAFAPDGTLAARYDKIHLFCFDNGRERYDEGRVLRAGIVAGSPAMMAFMPAQRPF